MLRVNQAVERDGVSLKVGLRILGGVVEDGDDFHILFYEILVMFRQLTDVPAAKRSTEATQEHQDDASVPAVVTQGDLSSRGGLECEVRCYRAGSYSCAGDWHALLPLFFGEINQKNVVLKQ